MHLLEFLEVYSLQDRNLRLLAQAVAESVGAAVASINNTAHGLHSDGPASNLHALSAAQTWICTGAMLLGRLEIFSVIVLFTPAFWRK